MPKRNAFLERVAAEKAAACRIQRLFTIQQCEDMMLIAVNEAFGLGPERAPKLREKYREVFREYAEFAVEDGKDDPDIEYTKGKLDQRLASILGDAFVPWEDRYPEVR